MRFFSKNNILCLLSHTGSRLKSSYAELLKKNFSLIDSEKRLRDSEAFLSSVIENIPNMIFVKEADSLRFVRFNRAGEKLLGRNREELIGKNDFDFFPPEQAEFFVAKDREVLNSKQQLTIEEENISVPGGIRILQTRKIPLIGPDGKPKYLLGISEDITERKEHEAQKCQLQTEIIARQAAEAVARRLTFLDAVNKDIISTLDIPEAIEAVTRTLKNEFHRETCIESFDLDKLCGFDFASLREHFPSEKTQIFTQPQLQKLLAKVGIKCLNADFSSAVVAPLIVRDHFYGVIVLYNQNGQTLDESVFNLLDLITPRLALAIENARLYARARAASQAKSDFLANISHEVRTPLGAIIGFAELALEKAEPGSFIGDSLGTISRNGNQLLALVNEILDLSKVESKKMEIEKMPFSLVYLLTEVRAMLNMKAQQKDVSLDIDLKNLSSEFIITDPLRLRQILLNLIGNSLKFTSHGRILLRVSEQKISAQQSRLSFEIADTGIGMTTEQQEKLFSPFQQGDNSMSRRYGGTGLGLFLSRKLAELLGGELKLISSAPNKGSTFQVLITVEISKSINPTRNNLSAKNAQPQDLPLNTPDKKVLVVDDSSENRVLMDAYLKRLHIEHDFAENGIQALDKMFSQDYSMVFMDVQMPEMDGFTAIEKARKKGYRGRVIALTAHAMKGDREQCLNAGFDDYLCKPLSRKTLEAFLQRENQQLH